MVHQSDNSLSSLESTRAVRSRLARGVLRRRELCRVVQSGTVKGQKKVGEQQGCEVLDAREAPVIRVRTSQRSVSQCWVTLQSRHHKSAETTKAGVLISLAVEVKLNGTVNLPERKEVQRATCRLVNECGSASDEGPSNCALQTTC